MPALKHENEDEPIEDDPASSAAEVPSERSDAAVAPNGGVVAAPVDATFEIPTASGTVRMTVPDAATAEEAAAVAAAVAAHVDEEEEDDTADEADRWTLSRRLDRRSRDELPRACARGEEWKAAARTGR